MGTLARGAFAAALGTMEVQDSGALAGVNGSAPGPRAARGRWTAQQRRKILEASMAEGAVIGDVADRFGVRAALIESWRQQLERQPVRGADPKVTRYR
jgi:hypothetical protein